MLNLRPVVVGYVPGAYIRPVDDKQNPLAPVKMSTPNTVRIYRVTTYAMNTNRRNLTGIQPGDFFRAETHDQKYTESIDYAKHEFSIRWNNYRHEGPDGAAVEYELCYADITPDEGEDAADVVNGLYTYAPKSIEWKTLEDAGCPSGDASWCAFYMNPIEA